MAKFCPECGAAIEEGVKFCPECGTVIPVEQTASPEKPAAAEKEKKDSVPKAAAPEKKAEPKTEKVKKPVSVGAACAAFLMGAKMVPYVLRSLWLMTTMNVLTPFQYVLTEILGMAAAFCLIMVFAKGFAANSRESKTAVSERSLLITGAYFAIDRGGAFAMEKFAPSLTTQDLINTGVIALVILIACLWVYSQICALVSAGEKKVSFGAKLLGGILLFLVYNMEEIILLALTFVPISYGRSFLTTCSLILITILAQGTLVHGAVSLGLKKAKVKEKISARVHMSRTVVGGGLAFLSAIFLLGTNRRPSAEIMCEQDLSYEIAQAYLALGIGDTAGAVRTLTDVEAHMNAWKQIAEGSGVEYSAQFAQDDMLAALYYLDHPDRITDKALTDIIGVDNAVWPPFYISVLHDIKEPDDRQKAVQKEAAYLCIAYDTFVNALPDLEDIRKSSESIVKVCENYNDIVDYKRVYQVMNATVRGEMSQESAVYYLLDYADEHPTSLMAQMIALESGVGYLKDNASHYERVAQVITRVDDLLEQAKLSDDMLAKFKNLFGDYLSAMNNLEEAEKYYQQAGQSGEGIQKINQTMAIKAFMANDDEKCYEYTMKLVDSGDQSAIVLQLYTVCSLKKGDYAAAIKSASQLADLVKKGGEGEEYHLADLCLFDCVQYLAMRDDGYWTDFEYSIYSEEMDGELTALFEANPFLNQYCKVLYLDKMYGDYERAQACADELVKECPGSAQVWYLRGLTYADGEKHEEASVSFEKSLELDNKQLSTMFALANSYDALGRYQEAYDLTVYVEAEMGKDTEVNHSADVYGLGYHNPRLREALEYKLQEEGEE